MSVSAAASSAASVASLLGLSSRKPMTDLDLAAKVRDGFPPKSAERVARWIDPDGAMIGPTAFVPKATFHRAVAGNRPLSREYSERLLALARVLSEALRTYHGDKEAALEFLSGPHPMLGWRSALDLACESTAGADVVLRLLTRAEAGVAV